MYAAFYETNHLYQYIDLDKKMYLIFYGDVKKTILNFLFR